MVDPGRMCRQHLLGEHNEVHMACGSVSKKKNIAGFLAGRLIEPASIKARHDELALEMEKRGYAHNSPIHSQPDCSYLGELSGTLVDPGESYEELLNRCRQCRSFALIRH